MKTKKRTVPKHTPQAEVEALAALLAASASAGNLPALLREILTPAELHNITLRLKLLRMLCDGVSQRNITAALGISLCKITRGSRILKPPDSVSASLIKNL